MLQYIVGILFYCCFGFNYGAIIFCLTNMIANKYSNNSLLLFFNLCIYLLFGYSYMLVYCMSNSLLKITQTNITNIINKRMTNYYEYLDNKIFSFLFNNKYCQKMFNLYKSKTLCDTKLQYDDDELNKFERELDIELEELTKKYDVDNNDVRKLTGTFLEDTNFMNLVNDMRASIGKKPLTNDNIRNIFMP